MRVLSLDTSTELGSAAVLVNEELRSEVAARVRARHGETLFPMIEEALRLGGVDRSELDLIAVGVGPGSFTGTRIGVATAKGLAIALKIELVGVVSLRAIARAAPSPRINVAIDAHKGEVYAASYDGEEEVVAPFHAPPELARERLIAGVPFIGSGVGRYPGVFGPRSLPQLHDLARASFVALEAIARYGTQGPDDRATLEPLYLRPSDAELPRR